MTFKYVHGFSAARELPIVWKIAKGSLFKKLEITAVHHAIHEIAVSASAVAPAANRAIERM